MPAQTGELTFCGEADGAFCATKVGTLPATRGAVFVAGIGQATTDLSLYQARLQDWYDDATFWSDLGRFASDWSQEVYGDIRHYAVAGATRETRRDLLNEYLQHESTLAGVAIFTIVSALARVSLRHWHESEVSLEH